VRFYVVNILNRGNSMIPIPKLPYAEDALEPHMSKDTVALHYGKHTTKYYETLNTLIKGTSFEDTVDTLEQLVNKKALVSGDTALFNNAAQAWNHTFFWRCLAPTSSAGKMSPDLEKAVIREYGSVDKFKDAVIEKANKHFGSGWCWVIVKNGKITIKTLPNASTPLTSSGEVPLFTIDLWEHAWLYDPQYAANKLAYIKATWNILDWTFINGNYKKATDE
jgi:Fe-Mn family superoxide dismutase